MLGAYDWDLYNYISISEQKHQLLDAISLLIVILKMATNATPVVCNACIRSGGGAPLCSSCGNFVHTTTTPGKIVKEEGYGSELHYNESVESGEKFIIGPYLLVLPFLNLIMKYHKFPLHFVRQPQARSQPINRMGLDFFSCCVNADDTSFSCLRTCAYAVN